MHIWTVMADAITMSVLNCNLYIYFGIVESIVLAKFVEHSESFYWTRRFIAIHSRIVFMSAVHMRIHPAKNSVRLTSELLVFEVWCLMHEMNFTSAASESRKRNSHLSASHGPPWSDRRNNIWRRSPSFVAFSPAVRVSSSHGVMDQFQTCTKW